MRRVEPPAQAFQAPVDVHASADGQVYMFRRQRAESSHSSSSSEEEDLDVLELSPLVQPEPDRLGRVQRLEGDNLNKLALQYGVKVAGVERGNGLFHGQELSALKSVTAPVEKHRFPTEADADLSGPRKETRSPPAASPPPHPAGRARAPAGRAWAPAERARAPAGLQEVSGFFRDVERDVEKLIQSTDRRGDISPRPASELSARPGVSGRRGVVVGGHGETGGLQWWNLVVAVLLIGVVLPIFYAVYLRTKASGAAGAPGGGASGGANASADSTGSGLGATVRSQGHWGPLVS
ncbi:unnamed protein product [Lota lota]